jgi:hypothetical protein
VTEIETNRSNVFNFGTNRAKGFLIAAASLGLLWSIAYIKGRGEKSISNLKNKEKEN